MYGSSMSSKAVVVAMTMAAVMVLPTCVVANPIALALPLPSPPPSTSSSTTTPAAAKVSLIHQFPNGTWLENITQRPLSASSSSSSSSSSSGSGLILTTELTAPNIWQLDPNKPSSQRPVLITTVPEKLGLLGITQTAPDVFAFIGGNFSLTGGGSVAPRSFSIYSVDLTSTKPVTTKLADVPDALLLNGLTFIPAAPPHSYSSDSSRSESKRSKPSTKPKGMLLATDSFKGVIWSLDLQSTSSPSPAIWSNASLLAPCDGGVLGANGIKYDPRHHKVYFSNSQCQGGFLASIPVDPNTGKPATQTASLVGGKSQHVSIDDFDIDLSATKGVGKAFVAAGTDHQVDSVGLNDGMVMTVAGRVNSTEINQPTAVKVGLTAADRKKGRLFVSTAGGQILAVETR